MRERIYIVIIMMLFVQLAFAQRYPLKTFYAFEQRVLEGKNDVLKKDRPKKTIYHIYAELQPLQSITISALWINGQQYEFDTAAVETPVRLEESLKFPGKNTLPELIAATKNTVIKVHALRPFTKGKKQPAHLKQYDLVMAYKSGNKTFYVGRKFTVIQPKLRQ